MEFRINAMHDMQQRRAASTPGRRAVDASRLCCMSCITPTRAAVSAAAAGGFAQCIYFLPLHLLVGGNDHLGHPVAVLNGVGLVGQVDEQHFYLAAVVSINGAGTIQDGDAVLVSHAAAGPYLRFVAYR